MNNRTTLRMTLALIMGSTMICSASSVFAFDMGNMMNPSKWMGGNRDRDYDDDGPWGGPGYDGPGSYGRGPGYGYGIPGGGYGGPGYGYGAPGGYGGGPGYGAPGGYGGGPGYAAPGGYGGPGYGYGAPGGYGGPSYGAPPIAAPSSEAPPASASPSVYGSPYRSTGGQSEIDDLRERIRTLEASGHR